MTHVAVHTDGSRTRITVSGHADHPDTSVCAGASMLTSTLISSMMEQQDEGRINDLDISIDESSPIASVVYNVNADSREYVDGVRDAIMTGFWLLSEQYPAHVTLDIE